MTRPCTGFQDRFESRCDIGSTNNDVRFSSYKHCSGIRLFGLR